MPTVCKLNMYRTHLPFRRNASERKNKGILQNSLRTDLSLRGGNTSERRGNLAITSPPKEGSL